MSSAHYPLPGFIFSSVLYHPERVEGQNLLHVFQSRFGACRSHRLSGQTMNSYYLRELSGQSNLSGELHLERQLERVLFVSEDAYPRKELISAKKWAWEREVESAFLGVRCENWDPGFICEEQVLLATGKPYAHRIYLGEGIYADLTFIAQKQKFVALPWTYPDYASAEMLEIFEYYRKQLIQLNRPLKALATAQKDAKSRASLLENDHH